MRPGVREAVLAWEDARKKAEEAYETNGAKMHAALEKVGGYATTSNGEGHNEGFCLCYLLCGSLWPGMGVVRVGEAWDAGHNMPAPVHPEVGDQIRALDNEYRSLHFAANDAGQAVTALYADLFPTSENASGRTPSDHAEIIRVLVLDDEPK